MSSTKSRSRTPPELTERQLQVLQRLADGKMLKEVAFELGITLKAIENHIAVVKFKLDATTLSNCIAQGFRKGLLK